MQAPDNIISRYQEQGLFNCTGLNDLLLSTSEAECTTVRNSLLANHDFREYCQCSGYTDGPDLCTFCDLIDTSNTSHSEIGGMTCPQFKDFAESAQSEQICTFMLGEGQKTCCTQEEETCPLCGDNSTLGLPDRPVPLLDQSTCAEADEFGKDYLTNCSTIDAWTPGFDLRSWCGCENSGKPGGCYLCGPNGAVQNANLEFVLEYSGNNVTMTCQDAYDMSRYISDFRLCIELSATLEETCCDEFSTLEPATKAPSASPTTTPGPTAAPTSRPTMTMAPTAPTLTPTNTPTGQPTAGPTSSPTASPTTIPTSLPTTAPTDLPTAPPSVSNDVGSGQNTTATSGSINIGASVWMGVCLINVMLRRVIG